MTRLEEMMSGMLASGRTETPRPSPVESAHILSTSFAAMNRKSDLKPGMIVRMKPDLHTGMFSSENPVYLFLEYLEHPIEAIDFVKELHSLIGGSATMVLDATVLALDSDNEVCKLFVESAWFEEAV